ncbi:MAG: type II CAAX endopeptidase family protein, partial [Vicinamibacterales bacterium]
MKRPAFWAAFVLLSLAAGVFAVRYFPQAFSLVAIDLSMDREGALAEARTIAVRDGLGPSSARQAASFSLDSETQTFVELEGGGKPAFTAMLRDGLYSAYTWQVRQFKEAEPNEVLIRFTPGGRPYGFVERVPEDRPGPALDAEAARAIAVEGATSRWDIRLDEYVPVEQGTDTRPNGRVDHTFTYERPSPTLGEGRYRVRLRVSGDRLTEVTHFVQIPEAFTRRYQEMRAANDAIGIGSVVGLGLVYVVGGIGVGLFFLGRMRWVVWRPAIYWGVGIATLQALAQVNAWPLAWMSYDTALPLSTFYAQQVAVVIASILGFSAFFTLSFVAAESLSRRAFGSHPQLWRAWRPGPGASTAILGRTVSGYLLVPVFMAYEVGLYIYATRVLGWWTPAETLLQPDALATYVPWLDAIANSLQAGFWEESLFRAVPIAGAALLGERFGRRGWWIAGGFVVQAVIFGAGHAPYPNLPAYARPVELLLPSVGFGLLYLAFGLVPGIVLHFTFDVVWFALPIFQARAPGIWVQQVMLVLATLVPLWVVLWRRATVGRWTTLDDRDRNAAWTPPPPPAAEPRAEIRTAWAPSALVLRGWLVAGLAGVAAVVAGMILGRPDAPFPASRAVAAQAARTALADRGVTLGPAWQVMPVPDNGSGGPHAFVAETAGPARHDALVGRYLPTPRWSVRVATFEGDVAARAEEWQVMVLPDGQVQRIAHTVPEARAGATLDEDAARAIAHDALRRDYGLDADAGQVREVSARPSRLAARTDWTFTFVDTTVAPLPEGEPRIQVSIAGDEVVSTGRFIFVPEEWTRRDRAVATRNTVVQIAITLVFGSVLVVAAGLGVVSWTKRRYAPVLFLAGAALMFVTAAANAINGWPTVMASLLTAQPLRFQVLILAGGGLVGFVILASLVGLILGYLPVLLARTSRLDTATATRTAVAVGLMAGGVSVGAGLLRTPAWAHFPDLAPLGTVVPFASVALGAITGYLTRVALVMTVLIGVDRMTAGWSRRRAAGLVPLVLLGLLAAGVPNGDRWLGWLGAGAALAAALVVA